MKASFNAITMTLTALLPFMAGAQSVISDLENMGSGVTTMYEGFIEPDDFAAEGILSDWEDLLKDFENTKNVPLYKAKDGMNLDAPLPRNNSVVNYPTTRLYDRKGNAYDVPYLPDENGIDLFFLMSEGIHVAMVIDSPAYMQLVDDDVIKWIRYYGYTKRHRTKTIFKRYEKWEPILKQYFSARGLPAELAELCLIESGCMYKAVSPVGATGMWQIMPETGRRFGMTINEVTDDRLDPVLSTIAATKILASNFKKTEDWTLAVAAYNCGSGRILKEKSKGRKNWYEMKKYLPKETSQYIPSLIAIHYVWTYRERLGFV